MKVLDTVEELRAALESHRRGGERIGLVPTLGALHEGHASHMRRARAECDVVVVSIFVNPLQFGQGEDFTRYPRDLDRDLAFLDPLGIDYVFHPDHTAFTPEGARTKVVVSGLTGVLEGASRPGHFEGVATIVTKLLNACRPDRAYFGEKDFQQLAIVRTLAADLNLGVEIVGGETVRDPDGLAMSSRNVYLSPAEREQGLAIPRALHDAASTWDGNADSARTRLRRTLENAPGVRLDYAEVCDPETLEPLEGVVEGPAQALVAAHVGTTRLIDNIRLEPRG